MAHQLKEGVVFDPGKETVVHALGKSWRFGRLEWSVLEQFVDWIKTQEGDVFAGLERLVAALPREDALALVKEAKDRRDAVQLMDLNDPLIRRYMQTPRGLMRLMLYALQVHHPDATINTVFEIAKEAGMLKLQEAAARGAGDTGPNAGAPAAP